MYQTLKSDMIDDFFDAADSPARSYSAQRFDEFDNDFDELDGFDALEDEDFDAASRGVREQRARAERQRQQAQQRSQQVPQPSTSSSASASGRPGIGQSALSRGHQIFHDPRTKAWLQTAGSVLNTSCPKYTAHCTATSRSTVQVAANPTLVRRLSQ